MLIEAAAELPSIELDFEHAVMDADPAAATLQIRDRHDRTTAEPAQGPVIGADGAGSALRQALQRRDLLHSTEEPLEHDYKELHIPAPADGSWPLEPHALHIWPRGGYMLIALPNPDRSFTATLFLPARGTGSFESLAAPQRARAFFATRVPRRAGADPGFRAAIRRASAGPARHAPLLAVARAAHRCSSATPRTRSCPSMARA